MLDILAELVYSEAMEIIIGLFVFGLFIWLALTVFSLVFSLAAALVGGIFAGIGYLFNKVKGL